MLLKYFIIQSVSVDSSYMLYDKHWMEIVENTFHVQQLIRIKHKDESFLFVYLWYRIYSFSQYHDIFLGATTRASTNSCCQVYCPKFSPQVWISIFAMICPWLLQTIHYYPVIFWSFSRHCNPFEYRVTDRQIFSVPWLNYGIPAKEWQ